MLTVHFRLEEDGESQTQLLDPATQKPLPGVFLSECEPLKILDPPDFEPKTTIPAAKKKPAASSSSSSSIVEEAPELVKVQSLKTKKIGLVPASVITIAQMRDMRADIVHPESGEVLLLIFAI